MLKIVKRLLASLGFLAIIPLFMSRRSRVCRTTWIDAPPSGIFPFINNLRNWPLWAEPRARETVTRRYEGPEAGAGAVQHRRTPCAENTLEIISSVQDDHVSYFLNMQNGYCHIEGVVSLERVGEGTRVTWACWWLGGGSLYSRYFDVAVRFWTGRDFAKGLRNLKDLAESCRELEAV